MNDLKNNNAFCVAPWVHMHVEPTGDVQLCCASNWKHQHNKSLGNLNDSTPLEIWNNDQYRNIRTKMLAGEFLGNYCNACYERERGAINWTERQRLNKEFPEGFNIASTATQPDGSLEVMVPEAGTAVYEVDRHTKQYKTIGMMPYLRNSCMIICPYDMLTWHGVNMLTEDLNRDSTVIVFSALEWNNKQMHYAEWKPGDTVNYEFL